MQIQRRLMSDRMMMKSKTQQVGRTNGEHRNRSQQCRRKRRKQRSIAGNQPKKASLTHFIVLVGLCASVLTEPGHSRTSGQCIPMRMLAVELHVLDWCVRARALRTAAFINIELKRISVRVLKCSNAWWASSIRGRWQVQYLYLFLPFCLFVLLTSTFVSSWHSFLPQSAWTNKHTIITSIYLHSPAVTQNIQMHAPIQAHTHTSWIGMYSSHMPSLAGQIHQHRC